MFTLSKIRVIELGGLAPVPYCGMMLKDYGASVFRIQAKSDNMPQEVLNNGKTVLTLDLKNQKDKLVLSKLLTKADVLIDSYRPGVMEKLGFDPSHLHEMNPGLIIARLTGYGQPTKSDTPEMSKLRAQAGHDINYLAMSGLLNYLGNDDNNVAPAAPINVMGDMAGGSALCTIGILLALLERAQTGKGSVVDSSMTHGVSYLSSFVYRSMRHYPMLWPQPDKRAGNLLDGGAPFYRTYRTKDSRYVAVGALEPKFYSHLLKLLDVSESEVPAQSNLPEWPGMAARFQEIFAGKTLNEWEQRIRKLEQADAQFDCCVTPVMTWQEAESFWGTGSVEDQGIGVQPQVKGGRTSKERKNDAGSLFGWADLSKEELAKVLKAKL